MFLIDINDKKPIFIQIQDQILKFIQAGVLRPGDRLPSVRQLAKENGINPNTAARAYEELEKNGWVYNVPKKGVYVKDIHPDSSYKRETYEIITRLHHAGVSRKLLEDTIREIYGKDGGYAED